MRLFRPHIPLAVRVQVAERQLVERGIWNENHVAVMAGSTLPSGIRLSHALCLLFPEGECHLDHDPSLGARGRTGEGEDTVYDPPANDPRFLVYRTKSGHEAKTNLRGEHGQHPDRVLIKKERRRRSAPSGTKKALKSARKIPSRPLRSRNDLRRARPRHEQLPLPPRRAR